MKTLFKILLVTVAFTSCQKEKNYTCTCTKTSIDLFTGNKITNVTNHPITDKKKKAENRCKAFESSATAFQSENCNLH